MTAVRPRVLCVDDDPGIVRSLTWLLRQEFDVVTTTDPTAAVALATRERFDVVVSDQRMPVMTGVEVLRRIREAAPAAMRILLTGYSELDAIFGSINDGEVFRFVTKPWDNDELRRIVRLAASAGRAAVPDDAASRPAAVRDDRRPRILLVDDSVRTYDLVREAAGDRATVTHARNLREAIGVLESDDVAVMVTEAGIGEMDAARMINLLKRERPGLVTVVITEARDADLVIRLINHGQIYRFVPKPVRAGLLRLSIEAALARHRQLERNPALVSRHAVEPLGADSRWGVGQVPAMAPAGLAVAREPPRAGRPVSLLRRWLGW